MNRLHVIYVPGLGDSRKAGQQVAIEVWRLYGVSSELVAMNWGDDEAWESKFERLLTAIDVAAERGKAVGLVGVSAGASAVLNAYAVRKDKVCGVVCLSGKINRPDTIGVAYRSHNPAFVTSAYECQNALDSLSKKDRLRILSRYGRSDGIVSPVDSQIKGAHNQEAPTVGHALSIAFQITMGAPSLIRFLKKQI